jgi:plasmid stabilization system protein ParE
MGFRPGKSMPNKLKLIWEPGALDDLARLREFLQSKNPKAAANAAQSIIKTANLLVEYPHLGHPMDDLPEFNKIFIPFGQNGYDLHYRIDHENIVILRIWHTREKRNS